MLHITTIHSPNFLSETPKFPAIIIVTVGNYGWAVWLNIFRCKAVDCDSQPTGSTIIGWWGHPIRGHEPCQQGERFIEMWNIIGAYCYTCPAGIGQLLGPWRLLWCCGLPGRARNGENYACRCSFVCVLVFRLCICVRNIALVSRVKAFVKWSIQHLYIAAVCRMEFSIKFSFQCP